MLTNIIIFIAVFLFANTASAAWYIYDKQSGRVNSIANYKPSVDDLMLRNEGAAESSEKLSIYEAVYKDGVITKREKTPEEIELDKKEKAISDEMKKVYHKMFVNAFKECVKDGHSFNNLQAHVEAMEQEIKITEEEGLVEKRTMKDTIKKMKEEGHVFNHIDKND